ncbi:helix-turn-helix domain-containing protein [Apilactobacillus timberlakei]|nr:helix-turn-helix transcriptional regulator [Apilactobacillus timberlakei]
MTFGEKIKHLRQLNSWTMNDFIQRFNDENQTKVSRGRLSMWENDLNDPSFRVVQSIARMFNISVDYFGDDAKSLSKYRKDDSGANELMSIYSDLVPRRKKSLLEYARTQHNEQQK